MKTYPLLQSQLGVFYECLKYPQVMQYNIPCIVPLSDDIDMDRVETSIQAIFAARQELRIRFFIDDQGEPQQYVDDTKTLTVVRREMTEDEFQDYAHHGFCRPFDMRWIESTNDYTTQVLYRLGFQWPPTSADYVHRFVDTIVGFDYFTI